MKVKSVGNLDVPDTLSWVDEERDVSCWLGNAMQREAFNKLYSVADRLRIADDPRINQDWDYLQASNNFRFMTTKPSNVGLDRGIYSDPFDAFTNYMNILGDFINRVNALYPQEIENDELNALLTTIRNQGDEIEMKDKEITRLKARLEQLDPTAVAEEQPKAAAPAAKAAPAKKPAAKKPAAKKPAAKKPAAAPAPKAEEEKK
jgi:alpha-amylase